MESAPLSSALVSLFRSCSEYFTYSMVCFFKYSTLDFFAAESTGWENNKWVWFIGSQVKQSDVSLVVCIWWMIRSCPINSIYGSKENVLLTSFISRHQCSGPNWNRPNNNKYIQCSYKEEKKHGRLCHVEELTEHFSIYWSILVNRLGFNLYHSEIII